MLDLNDERWPGLKGGYKMAFDPRPCLKQLESGTDVDAAWHELWENLHHQGDVGEASYASVPHLVRIHREHGSGGWNEYALIAIIELARAQGDNPAVPPWLAGDYLAAIQELARLGTEEIAGTEDADTVRAILSILAIAKNLRTHARFLISYSEDEMKLIEKNADF